MNKTKIINCGMPNIYRLDADYNILSTSSLLNTSINLYVLFEHQDYSTLYVNRNKYLFLNENIDILKYTWDEKAKELESTKDLIIEYKEKCSDIKVKTSFKMVNFPNIIDNIESYDYVKVLFDTRYMYYVVFDYNFINTDYINNEKKIIDSIIKEIQGDNRQSDIEKTDCAIKTQEYIINEAFKNKMDVSIDASHFEATIVFKKCDKTATVEFNLINDNDYKEKIVNCISKLKEEIKNENN